MATTSLITIAAANKANISYVINPEYYDALAAGTDLSGYSFSNAATADSVVSAAVAVGDTDWMWVVYQSTGAPTEARHTFVYNTVTKEVVRYYELLATVYYYWTHEEVLASFATRGSTSFFTAIVKTRNVTLIDAGELATVDGAVAGWTAYHDSLVTELKGLIDKYGWQDSEAIAARVSSIQEELRSIGATLVDQPLQALLADFEAARIEVKDLNEARYAQLTDPATGTIDPTAVMSYPQIAKYLKDTYFDPLKTAYEDAATEQAALDQEIIDALESLNTTVQSMLEALGRTPDNIGLMKVEAYQTLHTMRIQQMMTKAENAKNLGIQARAWLVEMSNRLAMLYGLAPSVVERRTDVGPDLAAVANLTMQVGRGQANQQMLASFGPQSFISPAGSSSASLGSALSNALGPQQSQQSSAPAAPAPVQSQIASRAPISRRSM